MKTTRLFQFLIIGSLLFSLAGLPVQQALAGKVQPMLRELAGQDPHQLVDVIVRKVAGTTGTEARAAALAGRVTSDLHTINAFAAKMTAGAGAGNKEERAPNGAEPRCGLKGMNQTGHSETPAEETIPQAFRKQGISWEARAC